MLRKQDKPPTPSPSPQTTTIEACSVSSSRMDVRTRHTNHSHCFFTLLHGWWRPTASHTYVNVMAPRFSVNPNTRLGKPVLFHMILLVSVVRASTSSSTWFQMLPINILVQCGMFSTSKSQSLHTYAVLLKALHRTSVVHFDNHNRFLCPKLLPKPLTLPFFSSCHLSILL